MTACTLYIDQSAMPAIRYFFDCLGLDVKDNHPFGKSVLVTAKPDSGWAAMKTASADPLPRADSVSE